MESDETLPAPRDLQRRRSSPYYGTTHPDHDTESEETVPGQSLERSGAGSATSQPTLLDRLLPLDRQGLRHLLQEAGMPVDHDTWGETERLFEEIDMDRDGFVSVDEILMYWEKDQVQRDKSVQERPTSWRGWIRVYSVPLGHTGTYDPRSTAEDRLIAISVLVFKTLSLCITLLSLALLMTVSIPDLQRRDDVRGFTRQGTDVTFALEVLCYSFFTVEFVLYLVSYPHGVLKLLVDVEVLVDVTSLVPFYLMLIIESTRVGMAHGDWIRLFFCARGTRTVRILRILRGVTVLLSDDDHTTQQSVPKVLTALGRATIPLAWMVSMVASLMIIFATVVYYVELEEAEFDFDLEEWVRCNSSRYKDAGQPVAFQSIPEAMWWAIVTITTVGYGDVFPVTAGGKTVASCLMVLAFAILALPITIIGATFDEIHQDEARKIERQKRCRNFRSAIQRLEDRLQQQPDIGDHVIRRVHKSMRSRSRSLSISGRLNRGGGGGGIAPHESPTITGITPVASTREPFAIESGDDCPSSIAEWSVLLSRAPTSLLLKEIGARLRRAEAEVLESSLLH